MNKEIESSFLDNFFRSYITEQPGKLYVLSIILVLGAGALFSKFLISLSIFLLVLTVFFVLYRSEEGHLKLKIRSFRKKMIFQEFFSPPFYVFILLFSVTLFSALISEDVDNGLAKVQLRLPYLLLPFVFVFNKAITRRELYLLIYFFAIICAITAVGVLINYSFFFERITESLATGKSVPTPSNHIRYSLFLAFTSLASFYIFMQGVFSRRENLLLLLIAVFMAVSLHILAVRSGLFLWYLGAAYLLFTEFYNRLDKRILTIMAIAMLIFPFAAYKFIPSLENRVNYMIYDLKLYSEGSTRAYSDGDRLRSIVMGWELFKNNPVLGCGVGDIQVATEEIFKTKYDDSVNVRQPHNQVVYFLASTGLLGALLSLSALLLPYFMNNRRERALLNLHGIVFLTSCTIEATIEGTNGICFHLFFLLPLMSMNKGIKE